MKVRLRKFTEEDIANKVRWINDPRNNEYLHYELPLEEGKTHQWFARVKDRKDRYDAVIEADGRPVGLIGLLSIDPVQGDAEYYISMGETDCKGKGVARAASEQLLDYAFRTLGLEKVYLYTETGNLPAQRLFHRVGFRIKDVLKRDLFCRGHYVDRFLLEISRDRFLSASGRTPVHYAGLLEGNNRLFVKRDDLLPFSFGGNKARKAELFFQEIDEGGYDCVVSYGSSHSNHCRIIANQAAVRSMPCLLIQPKEVSMPTFNSSLTELLGAKRLTVPVDRVHDTIEETLEELRSQGAKPYFIPGGGHGDLGTEAYVRCYDEIRDYEAEQGVHFDYLFFASGTGTTQAGLISGKLLRGDEREIVGISIARSNPRGRDVVLDSVRSYLTTRDQTVPPEAVERATIFVDKYICSGYGKTEQGVLNTIRCAMLRYGVPLDSTYTGKAFYGMERYLEEYGIRDKRILFLHTGGTPLFFDDLPSLAYDGEDGT